MCFHGWRLRWPCHWILRYSWMKKWGIKVVFCIFLYIILTIFGRNKAIVTSIDHSNLPIILTPIIHIVPSRDAKYLTNTFLHNNQERNDHHLNFQTDLWMATWYSVFRELAKVKAQKKLQLWDNLPQWSSRTYCSLYSTNLLARYAYASCFLLCFWVHKMLWIFHIT